MSKPPRAADEEAKMSRSFYRRKLDICTKASDGWSYCRVSEDYGSAKSTVCDIVITKNCGLSALSCKTTIGPKNAAYIVRVQPFIRVCGK